MAIRFSRLDYLLSYVYKFYYKNLGGSFHYEILDTVMVVGISHRQWERKRTEGHELNRKVKFFNGKVTATRQKRKKHCNYISYSSHWFICFWLQPCVCFILAHSANSIRQRDWLSSWLPFSNRIFNINRVGNLFWVILLNFNWNRLDLKGAKIVDYIQNLCTKGYLSLPQDSAFSNPDYLDSRRKFTI